MILAGTVVASQEVTSVARIGETIYVDFADGTQLEGSLEMLQQVATVDVKSVLRQVLIARGVAGGVDSLDSLVGKSISYIHGNSVVASVEQ